MPTFRSLVHGAVCLRAALAYHASPEVDRTLAIGAAGDVQDVTEYVPSAPAGTPKVLDKLGSALPPEHGNGGASLNAPPWHQVKEAAAQTEALANLGAEPPSEHSEGGASFTTPQGGQASHKPETNPYPVAVLPGSTAGTSQTSAHESGAPQQPTGPPTAAAAPQQQQQQQQSAHPGASSEHSKGGAFSNSQQGHDTSHALGEGPHPSEKHPHQPPDVASPQKPLEATSQKLSRQSRDAAKAMAVADGRSEKAKAALVKANHVYAEARAEEQAAKKAQEAALKVLRASKDRRAAYYKQAKTESGGSSPKVKEADDVIRKAQRSYDMAGAKWQRVKDEAPKKALAIREAAAGVKEAEAAKFEAAKAGKAVEVAMREQTHKDEAAQREVQHLKEKQAKLREQKAEKVSELKEARQERLEKKKVATPEGVAQMKAHESNLVESVHAIDSIAKESRQELKAHKADGKASVHSAAKQ